MSRNLRTQGIFVLGWIGGMLAGSEPDGVTLITRIVVFAMIFIPLYVLALFIGRERKKPKKKGVCDCEFDDYLPDDDEYGEASWHYLRTCEYCGEIWQGLHCIHDGYQNPCPKCGKRPTVIEFYE